MSPQLRSWESPYSDLEKAKLLYDELGFVSIPDLFSEKDVVALRTAFDEAVAAGNLKLGEEEMPNCNDAIFFHPTFENYAKDERIVKLLSKLLKNQELELQHAKFNNKPARDQGKGEVKWHQDYPFFPHTCFDLIAIGIHLDDEDKDSGALRYMPGSQHGGLLSHCKDEVFAYECTRDMNPNGPTILATGRAGQVTAHHCLTLHQSAAKKKTGHRRLLVLQYRTADNAQIAGVIWRCTGYPIQSVNPIRTARFADGTVVELRGKGGRLYDLFGKLAPDDAKSTRKLEGY